ncbi:hypothetical protein FIB49_12085 [Lactococcus cremoris]|nr:hypothetical protein [Lactococcus cremoris]MCT4421037.1 hypothetical protein [Lactococcus cremoris]MCT4425060.1 hypothetical protein [Lactococcus cremoris]MCT4425744.1 hypothetical protein [Lactococcus cremoris]MRM44914.1 hypothetical protein [Lactococcus cremoris]
MRILINLVFELGESRFIMELVEGWSKNETLNRIYDLILEPTVSDEEREILVKAKEVLNKGEDVGQILEKLQANFQLLDNKNQLSIYGKDFYDSIPLSQDENKFSQKNIGISEGKIASFIGAALFTFIIFNSIVRVAGLMSMVPYSSTVGGSTITTFALFMILIDLIQIIFVWFAFSKYNGKSGNGWAIFLLVFGILVVISGMLSLLTNGLEGFGYIIAGAAMITAFILKQSELSRYR